MAEEEKTEDLASQVLAGEGSDDAGLNKIADIPIEVTVVLGAATMPVSKLLKLGRGAVIALDKKVGEPVDVYVNERLVAKGEVVIVENKIGVTMTEVVKSDDKE